MGVRASPRCAPTAPITRIMAATIIIYAGAIIVTFLFVLMLAQQEGPSDAAARSRCTGDDSGRRRCHSEDCTGLVSLAVAGCAQIW